MKPSPFSYHAPRTLEEALHLLATLDNARVLAGGQSLVPMLNYRVVQPDHLIDLGQIPELERIERSSGGLRVGAMTTQRTIERSAIIKESCPLLVDAIYHVGHQQTRNRGTIGGSLCHLDPSAELPVTACALNPTMSVASRDGRRELAFADFAAGYLTSTLEPNEILTSITFRPTTGSTGTAFEEFACRPADFAIVSVAATVTLAAGGDRIAEARLAIGGIAPIPRRLNEIETMLMEGPADPVRIKQAATMAAAQPSDGDHNNSAEYRQELAGLLTERALTKAIQRSRVTHE